MGVAHRGLASALPRFAIPGSAGDTMDQQQEMCVSGSVASLSQIAEFVADMATRAGLDEDQAYDVQVAVDEACTNSIQHAYAGREDGELHICCFLEDNDFVVRIVDFGRPFDPDSVPKPDLTSPLEERAIGGLGVYLMRTLMDQVTFRFDPQGGNQVVMRKSRGDSLP